MSIKDKKHLHEEKSASDIGSVFDDPENFLVKTADALTLGNKDVEDAITKPLKRVDKTVVNNAIDHLKKLGISAERFQDEFEVKTKPAIDRLRSLSQYKDLFQDDQAAFALIPKIGSEVSKILSGDFSNLIKEGYIMVSPSVERFLTKLSEANKPFFNVMNETDRDMAEMLGYLDEFLPFSKEQMGYDKPVTIRLISDANNADKVLGKTAHYNPAIGEVVVYTDNRHPKDIMRSISHELVHHTQNCRGEFDREMATEGDKPYMQTDKHLFEMEREAFEVGNVCFRTWEDNYKYNQRENNKMTISESTLREIIRNVLENKIKEAVDRPAGDSSPLTPEEIRAFLDAQGMGELTRYVQGDPELHRAPGTKSPYDTDPPKEEIPAGVTPEDEAEMAPEAEEEEEVTETIEEEVTDEQWYKGTLTEALIKRYAK